MPKKILISLGLITLTGCYFTRSDVTLPSEIERAATAAAPKEISPQERCQAILDRVRAEKSASAWIALAGVIQTEGAAPEHLSVQSCRPQVEAQLNSTISAATSNERLMVDLLLGQSGVQDWGAFLKENPRIVRGELHPRASSSQRLILQSIFCRPFGKLLADGPVPVSIEGEIPGFRNSFAGRCLERELRRRFLQDHRVSGGES